HLITTRTGEPYGFLLGHVVYCPWTAVPYIVIDTLRRETQSVPHGGDLDRFRHSWASASREARRRLGQVIGWYHRHGVLGLRLSEWDLQLQAEFFAEPWHCALVVAPGPDRVLGGFIQRSQRAHLFRRGLAPFYELAELGAKPIDGRCPSVVDWANYRTDEPVEIVHARWPQPRPVRSAQHGSEEDDRRASEAESEGTRERGGSVVAPRSRRRWRPAGSPTSSENGPDAGFVAEFARASQSADADLPEAAPPKPGRSRRARKPAPKPGETGARPPAREEPAVEDAIAFANAVWGPPRLTSEPVEEPLGRAEAEAAVLASETGVPPDPAELMLRAPWPPGDVTPRFAPETAEPYDADASLEWLASLLEERLRAPTPPPPVEREPETAPPAEEPPARTHPAAGAARPESAGAEPVLETTTPAVAAKRPAETAKAASRPPPMGAPPFRYAARPGPSRPVVVGHGGSDPEVDPEAEIPVVMPSEQAGSLRRFLHRHRRRLAGLLLLLVAALAVVVAVQRADQLARSPAAPSADLTPTFPAPTRPSAEYRRLSREFESAMSAYRDRSTDFDLRRLDCEGLATGLVTLEAAFQALSEQAAGETGAEDPLQASTERMEAARAHFAATGCEPPVSPGASGTEGGNASPA
ncbi:MAG: hypothetical protein ACRELC_06630, partial [Gemmatimonadota bacterium]